MGWWKADGSNSVWPGRGDGRGMDRERSKRMIVMCGKGIPEIMEFWCASGVMVCRRGGFICGANGFKKCRAENVVSKRFGRLYCQQGLSTMLTEHVTVYKVHHCYRSCHYHAVPRCVSQRHWQIESISWKIYSFKFTIKSSKPKNRKAQNVEESQSYRSPIFLKNFGYDFCNLGARIWY